MTGYSLIAIGLRKRYGTVAALDGFDLSIETGTIHGLLGPNGAGKSTAVRALATLIELDDGGATIAGHRLSDAVAVRRSIGLVAQNTTVDEILTGRQNLVMFARLLGLSRRDARSRALALLEQFELVEAAGKPVSAYSGGMRRRLDIAASLILRPEVLFLDEPTTGLDPRGRHEVWRAIVELRDRGTTVLLTTQYLDEADQLASRISVMNRGRVIAEGSPAALKSRLGQDRIEVVVSDEADLDSAASVIGGVTGTDVVTEQDTGTVTASAPTGTAALIETVRALDAAGIVASDINLRRPSLDEVFLTLTAAEEAA